MKHLGPRQRLCWVWAGISLKGRIDILDIMTRDKTLTLAHRKLARRKLREARRAQ